MENQLESLRIQCHSRKSPSPHPLFSPRSLRPPSPPPRPVTKLLNKKKNGRKKSGREAPPSSKHVDKSAPSLAILNRALNTLEDVTEKWSVKYQPRPLSATQDETGLTLCKGSRGGQYLGEVFGGLPHGIGKHWVRPNQHLAVEEKEHLLYDGAWERGMKSGNGTFFYPNHQEYRGGVRKGIRHGRGAMRFANGDIYHGDWWKSQRHGLGAFYYNDGATYIGRFTRNNRDGWGTVYWPDRRRKYEGEWHGDDPICGRWLTMIAKDFDMLADHRLHWPPALEHILKCGYPQEQVVIPFQELPHPEAVYFGRTLAMRHKRMDWANTTRLMLGRDDVKQMGSLKAEQMEGLWHAFHDINPDPGRTTLHYIHLRRLLLLARMNPDNEVGKVLLKRLVDSAMSTHGLTFNNFMHIIQAFNEPQATNTCPKVRKRGCCLPKRSGGQLPKPNDCPQVLPKPVALPKPLDLPKPGPDCGAPPKPGPDCGASTKPGDCEALPTPEECAALPQC